MNKIPLHQVIVAEIRREPRRPFVFPTLPAFISIETRLPDWPGARAWITPHIPDRLRFRRRNDTLELDYGHLADILHETTTGQYQILMILLHAVEKWIPRCINRSRIEDLFPAVADEATVERFSQMLRTQELDNEAANHPTYKQIISHIMGIEPCQPDPEFVAYIEWCRKALTMYPTRPLSFEQWRDPKLRGPIDAAMDGVFL
jgi:hypothetical protein